MLGPHYVIVTNILGVYVKEAERFIEKVCATKGEKSVCWDGKKYCRSACRCLWDKSVLRCMRVEVRLCGAFERKSARKQEWNCIEDTKS